MSKKLIVGGLSWGTSDETLRAAFEQFGEVADAKVIVDRETGRSRGFGFVTFADDEAASTAIDVMVGATLLTVTCTVSLPEPPSSSVTVTTTLRTPLSTKVWLGLFTAPLAVPSCHAHA